MSMSDEREILYVTPFRRRARKVEREITAKMNGRGKCGGDPGQRLVIPPWAQGVRVARAGRLSWAVVATSSRGH